LAEPLFYIAVGITFGFAFVNGFHDGGSVIATIICSRSMRPRRALLFAAVAEFVGALLFGTAVAHTISSNILRPEMMEQLGPARIYLTVIGGVAGAIVWLVSIWFIGLPSSGSHALIGGLAGAGLVALGTDGMVIDRLMKTVVAPLLLTPVAGMLVGFLVFSAIKGLFARAHRGVGQVFKVLQKPALIFLAASHGSNDAQKSMGVIALLLAASASQLHGELPVPQWAIIGCATAIPVGLMAGGRRIMKTVGLGIYRMEPVHSFASQFAAMSVILTASLAGGPVSTTQVVGASVMGVGAARRLSGVRWTTAGHIAYAWLLVLPVSAALGAFACWFLNWLFGA